MVGSGRERLNSKVVWPIAHLCGDTATKAMTWSSFSWFYLLLLCLSRQFSHLVWPGMAGLGQVLHRPASFFSCRTFFAWTLAASFRSAVWFLACSYKRRASRCSSGVLLGFGSFRGFSFLGPSFLTFLAFLGFWLGSGLVSSKRCWKVLSSVRGWGHGHGVHISCPQPVATHPDLAIVSMMVPLRVMGFDRVRTSMPISPFCSQGRLQGSNGIRGYC